MTDEQLIALAAHARRLLLALAAQSAMEAFGSPVLSLSGVVLRPADDDDEDAPDGAWVFEVHATAPAGTGLGSLTSRHVFADPSVSDLDSAVAMLSIQRPSIG